MNEIVTNDALSVTEANFHSLHFVKDEFVMAADLYRTEFKLLDTEQYVLELTPNC